MTIGGKPDWFLNCLGAGFVVVTFDQAVDNERIEVGPIEARVIRVGRDIDDPRGVLASRYGTSTGTTYLFRPDQYVAARWAGFDEGEISAALLRATAQDAVRQKEIAA
ncbi:hypothetical protein ABIF50_003404 [Bradyrhizobium diazoefficiens]|uniref:FAD-dependent oxidoreductase n=2 Tax=Bradyrhizobium diazoefficiens TaxID=1355477 RepID=A0A0E4BST6_9BRAD|nr:FAD-dependent oxidoreductase [Bradyrhizobium diazoefficiens]